jgi:regulator of cell morphogenesis and NO signaling
MYPDIRSIIKQMYELNNQKEMELVEKFFNDYFDEVTEHLKYEDEIAFPYMKSLHEHIVKQKPFDEPISYSVNEYKDHHNDIEEKLNDLKNLLVKYLPGKNDQKLRRRFFNSLIELEYDLNIHGKIEDMVLIPLVEEMELDLKKLR